MKMSMCDLVLLFFTVLLVPWITSAAFETCQRSYTKIGCFAGRVNFGTELVNYRNPTSQHNHNGNIINWRDFGGTMHSIACVCAERARAKGWTHFGIFWWGLCISTANKFDSTKFATANDCKGPKYKPCVKADETECSGKDRSTYVYKLDTPTTQPPTTIPPTTIAINPDLCSKKLDIAIALDCSSSLYQSDWENSKEFAKKFVDNVFLGDAYVKVGILSFSTNARIEAKFNAYENADELKNKISQIPYRGGFTRTDLVLKMINDDLFTASSGSRPDAKKIVILATDGRTLGRDGTVDWAGTISEPSTILKNAGVEIFAAGVGNDLSETELKIIVSSPSNSHIVHPKDYSTLRGSGGRLAGMACGDTFKNVAVGHPTQQSSTFSNYFGNSAHAVDGNWNTEYYSRSCTRTDPEANPWWRVDLGEEKEIFEVKVANRGDCCGSRLSTFEIRAGNSLSNNGNDNSLCGENLSLTTGEIKSFVCVRPLKGRYVNVRIPTSRQTLTLCEVGVIARVRAS